MEFKIDTKDIYTVLSPVTDRLDENLTASIEKKWTELVGEGAKNLIVDLQACTSSAPGVMDSLTQLHETFYTEECSLVFTHLQADVKRQLQDHEYFDAVNFVPTMVEAVDIISMEMLERDLLAEEEGDTEE